MRLFDLLFGSKEDGNNRPEYEDGNEIPADYECITVDPDKPGEKVENRRPVIFENGIM